MFDGSNDGNFEGIFPGGSFRSIGGKVLSSYYGIKLYSTSGEVVVTILVNLDVIIRWVDVGTYLVYLDGSFDGSNDGNFK